MCDACNHGIALDPFFANLINTKKGDKGDSAYQVAVLNGFVGTQAEWLLSLEAEPGTPGLSAYQVALANGFVGNQIQWLASLNGLDGSGFALVISDDRISVPAAANYPEGQLLYVTSRDVLYKKVGQAWTLVGATYAIIQEYLQPKILFLNQSNNEIVIPGIGGGITASSWSIQFKHTNGIMHLSVAIGWELAQIPFRKIWLRIDDLQEFSGFNFASTVNNDTKLVPVKNNGDIGGLGSAVVARIAYNEIVVGQTIIEFSNTTDWGATQADVLEINTTFTLNNVSPSTI